MRSPAGRRRPTRGSRSSFGCAVGELRPWHYEDPFFQEVPAAGGVDLTDVFAGKDVVALARATYDGLGVDTNAILDRSDLFPRDGKCQHAFCIDVDREGDVRVLANVADDRYWADTMLHELGHGAYDIGFDQGLPWLLRDCHLTVTEGIAILMGRLAQDAEWLREVVGLDSADVERLEAGLRAAQAAELLVFTRWVLVMTNFERALYADPEADLERSLVEARVPLPARDAAGRPQRAGLGGEDSRGVRAGLLPHVSLREPRRVAAPRDRSTASRAGSSAGARRARSSASRCSARASRCAGTG